MYIFFNFNDFFYNFYSIFFSYQKTIQKLKNSELLVDQLKENLLQISIEKGKLETLLEEQKKSFNERFELINESKKKFESVFKGLSADALGKMDEKASKEEDRRERTLANLVKPMKGIIE